MLKDEKINKIIEQLRGPMPPTLKEALILELYQLTNWRANSDKYSMHVIAHQVAMLEIFRCPVKVPDFELQRIATPEMELSYQSGLALGRLKKWDMIREAAFRIAAHSQLGADSSIKLATDIFEKTRVSIVENGE